MPVDLKEICPPCPPEADIVFSDKLPELLCACPPPPIAPFIPGPKITKETVTLDCYKTMLLNMVTEYYCQNPPKGCP